MGASSVADSISKIISPPIVAILASVIFSLHSPIGLGLLSPLVSVLLGLLFFSLFPFLPVIYSSKRRVVDLYVSRRAARTPFFLMTIASYLVGTATFFGTNTKIMFLLALGYVCVTSILMVVNFFWKISTHCAGVAGPITALTYVFGPIALPLFLLLVPLGWARLTLKAHTAAQILGGTALAILVAFTEYTLLYS